MNSQFTHLTLPFHFNSGMEGRVDLSQVSDFARRPSDIQLINTERGQIVLKREQDENFLFRVKKFQHKDDASVWFYKLELVEKIERTYDPQHYFQDFYYPTSSDLEILQAFKANILGQAAKLKGAVVPAQLVKPFSWHGSNFKLENVDKQVKKSKFVKKQPVSIKYEEELPLQGDGGQQENELVASLFKAKPIWFKTALLEQLEQRKVKDAEAAIQRYAYYYQDGPWARCYVAFGVNPKLEARFAYFQTVMIIQQNNKEIKLEGMIKHMKYQNVYQLSDVRDPEIEKLVQQTIEKAIKEELQPSKDYGWFDKRTYKQIVRLLKRTHQ